MNNVQFLAQTNHFASQVLNISSGAMVTNFVLLNMFYLYSQKWAAPSESQNRIFCSAEEISRLHFGWPVCEQINNNFLFLGGENLTNIPALHLYF